MDMTTAFRKLVAVSQREGRERFPNDPVVYGYQIGYLAGWIAQLIDSTDEERTERINDLIDKLNKEGD